MGGEHQVPPANRFRSNGRVGSIHDRCRGGYRRSLRVARSSARQRESRGSAYISQPQPVCGHGWLSGEQKIAFRSRDRFAIVWFSLSSRMNTSGISSLRSGPVIRVFRSFDENRYLQAVCQTFGIHWVHHTNCYPANELGVFRDQVVK